MIEDLTPKPRSVPENREQIKKRILFAEDEEVLRDLAQHFLTSAGYEVDIVENGQSLLEILQSGLTKYDLIVTDNTMPGIFGVDVLDKLKKDPNFIKFKNLPVIVYSSDIDVEDQVKGLGGTFCFKGDRATLLDVIHKIFSNHEEAK